MKKFVINNNIFEIIDTEEKAYWLGFIAADGCVTNGGKYGRQFDLRVNLATKDFSHLVKLQKFFVTDKPIQILKKFHKKRQKYYESCLLRVCSKKIVEDLIKNEVVPAKSKILKFPILAEGLQQHYIRGLFDGDGGWDISKENQMSFSICGANKLFIKTISEIISLSTELKENKIICDKNNVFRLQWQGNNNCERIFDWIYNNAKIFLDRKHDKSKRLKNNEDRNRNRGQKIYELDNKKNIIKTHENTYEAAKYYGCTDSTICNILNGIHKSRKNICLIRHNDYKSNITCGE